MPQLDIITKHLVSIHYINVTNYTAANQGLVYKSLCKVPYVMPVSPSVIDQVTLHDICIRVVLFSSLFPEDLKGD